MSDVEFGYYPCSRCGEVTYGPDLAIYTPPICEECVTREDYRDE